MIGWFVFALTVLGCLLCLAFLLTHRPTRWFTTTTLVTMGWEFLAFLVLLRSSVQLALTGGGSYTHSGVTAAAIFGLASLILIDVLVVGKIVSIARYKSVFEAEQERLKTHESK